MIKSILYYILVLLLVYSSGCCGKKSISRRYYTIDITEKMNASKSITGNLTNEYCEIARVDIVDAFSTQRIANQSQSHEITYYSYNEWAHNPSDIITRLLKQYIERQKIFRQVSTRFTVRAPDQRIETSIDHLEAIESKNQLEAYFEIEFRLVDLKTGSVLIKHHNINKRPLAEKDLNLFAAAISDILFEEMQAFSIKIKDLLQEKS